MKSILFTSIANFKNCSLISHRSHRRPFSLIFSSYSLRSTARGNSRTMPSKYSLSRPRSLPTSALSRQMQTSLRVLRTRQHTYEMQLIAYRWRNFHLLRSEDLQQRRSVFDELTTVTMLFLAAMFMRVICWLFRIRVSWRSTRVHRR